MIGEVTLGCALKQEPRHVEMDGEGLVKKGTMNKEVEAGSLWRATICLC